MVLNLFGFPENVVLQRVVEFGIRSGNVFLFDCVVGKSIQIVVVGEYGSFNVAVVVYLDEGIGEFAYGDVGLCGAVEFLHFRVLHFCLVRVFPYNGPEVIGLFNSIVGVVVCSVTANSLYSVRTGEISCFVVVGGVYEYVIYFSVCLFLVVVFGDCFFFVSISDY